MWRCFRLKLGPSAFTTYTLTLSYKPSPYINIKGKAASCSQYFEISFYITSYLYVKPEDVYSSALALYFIAPSATTCLEAKTNS